MAELLHDNIEAERRWGDQSGLSQSEGRRPRREVPDVLSWLQCFRVFASVISSKHPKRTRELWAYQTTIVRETRRCGGNGWKAYDAMFRQWVASSPGTDWAKLNSAIYAVTFLARSTKGRMCHHCLEDHHGADECTLAPRGQPRQPERVAALNPSTGSHPQRAPPVRRQVCFSWNEGRCSFPYCHYQHVCLRCRGEHRSWQCRAPPPHGSGPQGTTGPLAM